MRYSLLKTGGEQGYWMAVVAEETSALCGAGAPSDGLDARVIGGGSGGSGAATIVSHLGRRALLIEKDRHPRFHIGESLRPMSMALLNQFGGLDRAEALAVRTLGADFPSAGHARYQVLSFARSPNPTWSPPIQVRRQALDYLLFENAMVTEVTTVELPHITDAEFGADEVEAAGSGRS